MNHSLLVFLPGLLDFSGSDSLVGGTRDFVWEQANVHQLSPLPNEEILELSMLGLRSNGQIKLEAGPLRIASLKLEPPKTSTCWAIDLVSIDKVGLIQKAEIPTKEEQLWLNENLAKLNQKRLSVFHNIGNHWSAVMANGSPEHDANNPDLLIGKPLSESFPDGEDEKILRSIVEDSANILMGSPFNEMRIDKGILPLGALMPHGGGFMPRIPNLAFNYGLPIEIIADQSEWLGIASLVNCQFQSIEKPLSPDWAQFIPKNQARITISNIFQNYRQAGQLERAEALWDSFSKNLIELQIKKINHETPWRLAICSYEPNIGGIWAEWSALKSVQRVPFHERTFGDSKIAKYQLCETVQSFWR